MPGVVSALPLDTAFAVMGATFAGARSTVGGTRSRRRLATMTRPDRPGRTLLALGAALCAGCGGGGDGAPAAANLAPTVTLAAPTTVIQGSAVSLTASAADADDG